MQLLNIGCGSQFHTDWTNVDLVSTSPHVIACDILAGLPFEDDRFDMVYHSHILEHLDPLAGKNLLRECYRVTRLGGTVRVVVPDLEFCCRLYLEALEMVESDEMAVNKEHYEWALLNLIDQMVRTQSGGRMAEYILSPKLIDPQYVIENGGGGVVSEMRATLSSSEVSQQRSRQKSLSLKVLDLARNPSRWIEVPGKALSALRRDNANDVGKFHQTGEAHRWMYDRYSLRQMLKSVGFHQVEFLSPFESRVSSFSDYALDVRVDGTVHKPHSLFAEAQKLEEVS